MKFLQSRCWTIRRAERRVCKARGGQVLRCWPPWTGDTASFSLARRLPTFNSKALNITVGRKEGGREGRREGGRREEWGLPPLRLWTPCWRWRGAAAAAAAADSSNQSGLARRSPRSAVTDWRRLEETGGDWLAAAPPPAPPPPQHDRQHGLLSHSRKYFRTHSSKV